MKIFGDKLNLVVTVEAIFENLEKITDIISSRKVRTIIQKETDQFRLAGVDYIEKRVKELSIDETTSSKIIRNNLKIATALYEMTEEILRELIVYGS